ncbi:MAG: hypothetical protein OXG49_18485 [Chloroflexi bacterium]|nr:hypothetical protein [Chloroflexota bacterium]
MDLIALLKELTSTGISDFVFVGVTLVVVRYWFSETRREISKEIDDKVGSLKSDLEQLIKENRQEIAAFKTDSRQDFDAVRTETRQDFEAFRTDSRQHFDAFRTDSRQDFEAFRTDSRQELGQVKKSLEQSIEENRQEISAGRKYSEQSHKDIMLHLIDVRERLANIEGRLGAPTPRMPAVSPPLEAPAEEPSAQS